MTVHRTTSQEDKQIDYDAWLHTDLRCAHTKQDVLRIIYSYLENRRGLTNDRHLVKRVRETCRYECDYLRRERRDE